MKSTADTLASTEDESGQGRVHSGRGRDEVEAVAKSTVDETGPRSGPPWARPRTMSRIHGGQGRGISLIAGNARLGRGGGKKGFHPFVLSRMHSPWQH